jgi:hypothetical protein
MVQKCSVDSSLSDSEKSSGSCCVYDNEYSFSIKEGEFDFI